ncbi:MAG: ribonucleotide reductase subunit alpha [Roseateles depolymerans]|uniref:Ribonucleotide reductase subunit alpha n=1 Tax=Roseateles depolymerans TaxID=76731 RepID=A0A2W5FCK8_9BURK|nr:MAG: ribonucleotide reductase subunit alpha [Roseateles depolymerans]
MNIEHFNDLLAMARDQPEPQRLLMVFATAECEPDATPAQRAAHAAGEGGVLRPLMCVDKDPAELVDFDALAAEARHAGPAWQLMFTAALVGRTTASEVGRMLELLVKRVETGEFGGLLPFNPAGEVVLIG